MANENERYGGVPFIVGGVTYLCAPLSMGAMKRFQKSVTEITAGKVKPEESVDMMMAVIYSSLQRNYPDMTCEFIDENILDALNVRVCFQTVLLASGFKPQAEAGNAEAGSSQT